MKPLTGDVTAASQTDPIEVMPLEEFLCDFTTPPLRELLLESESRLVLKPRVPFGTGLKEAALFGAAAVGAVWLEWDRGIVIWLCIATAFMPCMHWVGRKSMSQWRSWSFDLATGQIIHGDVVFPIEHVGGVQCLEYVYKSDSTTALVTQVNLIGVDRKQRTCLCQGNALGYAEIAQRIAAFLNVPLIEHWPSVDVVRSTLRFAINGSRFLTVVGVIFLTLGVWLNTRFEWEPLMLLWIVLPIGVIGSGLYTLRVIKKDLARREARTFRSAETE